VDGMVGVGELQAIVQRNHLPVEIKDAGQTWVRIELKDEQTGLSKTESMAISDFMDLILHWRRHGCHEHACSVIHVALEPDA
jgi:hypothetical protein